MEQVHPRIRLVMLIRFGLAAAGTGIAAEQLVLALVELVAAGFRGPFLAIVQAGTLLGVGVWLIWMSYRMMDPSRKFPEWYSGILVVLLVVLLCL